MDPNLNHGSRIKEEPAQYSPPRYGKRARFECITIDDGEDTVVEEGEIDSDKESHPANRQHNDSGVFSCSSQGDSLPRLSEEREEEGEKEEEEKGVCCEFLADHQEYGRSLEEWRTKMDEYYANLEKIKRDWEMRNLHEMRRLRERSERDAQRIADLMLDVEFAQCEVNKSDNDLLLESVKLAQAQEEIKKLKGQCKELSADHLNAVKRMNAIEAQKGGVQQVAAAAAAKIKEDMDRLMEEEREKRRRVEEERDWYRTQWGAALAKIEEMNISFDSLRSSQLAIMNGELMKEKWKVIEAQRNCEKASAELKKTKEELENANEAQESLRRELEILEDDSKILRRDLHLKAKVAEVMKGHWEIAEERIKDLEAEILPHNSVKDMREEEEERKREKLIGGNAAGVAAAAAAIASEGEVIELECSEVRDKIAVVINEGTE